MYDLVIIGASPEGLRAARRGIENFQTARIALITQGWERVWAAKESEQNLVDTDRRESLRQLAALGVDVIPDCGQGQATATGFVWSMAQRELTARASLLTTASHQAQQDGLNQINQINLGNPTANPAAAKTWGIWGALPQNLILAQTLAHQGHTVQLFSRNAHLLPGEDREMSHLLQCYLATQGIKIWHNCRHFRSQFSKESQTYQLLFSSGVESHEIRVDAFERFPLPELPWHWLKNVSHFGTEIASNSSYIAVNDHLQTAHPQIFACGGWLKGYGSPAIALREADFVVDQVLGNIQNPINYGQIPFGIDLDPPWYRLGLSQQHATAQCTKIHIYDGYEPHQPNSPLRGLCKIITNEQDQILGAHWFGPSAKTGISVLTLAIAKSLTVEALRNLPVVDVNIAPVLQNLCRR